MRLILFTLFVSLFAASLMGQNQVPSITDLQVNITAPGMLQITYDLADPDNNDIDITLRVSDNDGETFDIDVADAIGDVGYPISPGSGKSINWDFFAKVPANGKFRVMLVADDREVVDIQEMVDQVDSSRLRSDLEMIVGVRHRIVAPTHLQAVRDLIRDRFEGHGLETESLPFVRSNLQGENIAGRKTGLTDEGRVYIIDGHYDSISNSPGADDNGSAIAGMLEALRVLANYNFKKSIKFVAFDLEEEGLLGSLHFVSTEGIKPYETVEGVYNFEMIGYYDDAPNTQTLPTGFNLLYPDVYNAIRNDGFRGNFITNVGIQSYPRLNQAFEDAANRYVPELKVISILAPSQWQALTPDLGRSDHAPFWVAGLPALMLTDGSNFRNPYYHTPNDTLGTLNFTFMSQVVKATVAAVAELAGVTHSSSVTTEVNIMTSTNNLADCGVTVYPNPIADRISLDLSGCISGETVLELFTISGKSVLHRTLKPGSSAINVQISGFSPGTYILVIRSEGGIYHEKLIVTR